MPDKGTRLNPKAEPIFHSILYPSPEQESLSKRHDWLSQAKRSAKLKKEYVLNGNKLVLAVPKEANPETAYPSLYADINFDQIINVVCGGADGDKTKAFYSDFCCDTDMLAYRHEVFSVLTNDAAYALIREFCSKIEYAQNALRYMARTAGSPQRDRYAIDAVFAYGSALRMLSSQSDSLLRGSDGLYAFAREAARAADEPGFRDLFAEVLAIRKETENTVVRVEIHPGRAAVCAGDLSLNYTERLRRTMRAESLWNVESNPETREIRLFHQQKLCPLEARVLERIIKRNPSLFERMRLAAARVQNPIPEFVARFAREIRFYTAFAAFMRARSDLTFALPEISGDGALDLRGCMDLALALTDAPVTANDLRLDGGERGVIVTGANQGGKTTFLRTIGQIVVMTMLGLPVCCSRASLPFYRQAFSVFSEAEDSTIDDGKLQEECARLKPVLSRADGDTFVVLNEMFSSTTARDALKLTIDVLDGLTKRRARVICVTHVHGIRSVRPGIVGMATEPPGTDGGRNYRIARCQSDGDAFARDLATRYDLTADGIRRRVRHES